MQQGVSDEGLACLFKMQKIAAAMELQDEIDKHNVFLMGQAETQPGHNLRQSSKMPLTHFLEQPKTIIGLENSCLSHSNT